MPNPAGKTKVASWQQKLAAPWDFDQVSTAFYPQSDLLELQEGDLPPYIIGSRNDYALGLCFLVGKKWIKANFTPEEFAEFTTYLLTRK